MTTAAVKAKFVVLEQVNPSLVPNGALFLDSTNGGAATIKNVGGGTDPLVGVTNYIMKVKVAGGAIGLNKPVAVVPATGKVLPADSDGVNQQDFIGYALQAALNDGDLINVLLVGANLAGALTGLGFVPGDDIYLAETGGFTNDPNSFTGGDDSIIKVGVADCAAGIASTTVTDLVTFAEVLTRP